MRAPASASSLVTVLLLLAPVTAEAEPAGDEPAETSGAQEPKTGEAASPRPTTDPDEDPRQPETVEVGPPKPKPKPKRSPPLGPTTTPTRARATSGAATSPSQEAGSPWIPAGEKDHMASQPLDADGVVFKPGTGLVLKSQDGRFSIAPRLRVQFRYTFQNDNEEDERGHSFQLRRARLQFKGNVFGPHNKYKVEFAFSPRDLGFEDGSPTRTPILTWYSEFDYLRDLTVKVGQYKIPFSRQRVISSGDLELVDRSLANGEFTLDRDIGLEVMSKDIGGLGYLRYHAGVFMGEGRDKFETEYDFGLHYLGRLEILPMGGADGKWDYSEADFDRLRKPRLSLGVAYSFIDNAKRDRGILGRTPLDGGTTDYQSVTADFFFKVAGFTLSGEFFFREGRREFGTAIITDDMGNETPSPRVPTRDGLGYFVQTGYLIARLPLGVAARWSQVFGLGAGNETSLSDGDEIGAALSYYIAQHPLKLQLDYFRKRRDTYDVDTLSFAKQSWADSSDEVRLQMQFAF